jgi:hypothetical protein
MIEDQLSLYPLKTSIVTGQAMPRQPFDVIRGNRLFRVATAQEVAVVSAEPAHHLMLLNRATIEAQRAGYGMPDKCPVQGDILDSDEPIDIVIAGRMLRVCCGRCVRVVRARPSQYLGMIEYANRAASHKLQSASGVSK